MNKVAEYEKLKKQRRKLFASNDSGKALKITKIDKKIKSLGLTAEQKIAAISVSK